MIELYFSTVKILAQRPTHKSTVLLRERERERREREREGGERERERERERRVSDERERVIDD